MNLLRRIEIYKKLIHLYKQGPCYETKWGLCHASSYITGRYRYVELDKLPELLRLLPEKYRKGDLYWAYPQGHIEPRLEVLELALKESGETLLGWVLSTASVAAGILIVIFNLIK